MPTIVLYDLSRDDTSLVTWLGPDRETHSIDVVNNLPPPGQWKFTQDSGGENVMAFRPDFGDISDPGGTLVVSLDGAPSLSATLLHNEDDIPRRYFFATDFGNNNPLNRRAFILKVEGERGSPIARYAGLQVMIVVP